MEASFVDLRKKSKEIINALNRKEKVTVLYRGKPAAVMNPINTAAEASELSASQHAAFGIWTKDQGDNNDVTEQVSSLRRNRYDDL